MGEWENREPISLSPILPLSLSSFRASVVRFWLYMLYIWLRALLQRVQFELAKKDLKSFGFEQYLSSRRKNIIAFVDSDTIDNDSNALPIANTLHAGPLVQGAFNVISAARIDELLEIRVVIRPPELFARISYRSAPFFPSGAAVGPEDGLTGNRHRYGRT